MLPTQETIEFRMFELTDGDNCPSGTDEVVNDEVCFVKEFGSSGSGDGRIDEPSGLARLMNRRKHAVCCRH